MTNTFNRLQTLIEKHNFISTYNYFDTTVVHLRNSLGFDDEWERIPNPNFNYEVAAEVVALAEELGFEVEFTSEGI